MLLNDSLTLLQTSIKQQMQKRKNTRWIKTQQTALYETWHWKVGDVAERRVNTCSFCLLQRCLLVRWERGYRGEITPSRQIFVFQIIPANSVHSSAKSVSSNLGVIFNSDLTFEEQVKRQEWSSARCSREANQKSGCYIYIFSRLPLQPQSTTFKICRSQQTQCTFWTEVWWIHLHLTSLQWWADIWFVVIFLCHHVSSRCFWTCLIYHRSRPCSSQNGLMNLVCCQDNTVNIQ